MFFVDERTPYSALEEIRQRVRSSRFRVALTGAGISRASGLPLASENQSGVRVDRIFDLRFWREDQEKWFECYRAALRWTGARPNPAHAALAHSGFWIITQNVDGLHRLAGTEHLIELHGNLRELRCPRCEVILSSDLAHAKELPRCPTCNCVLHPGFSFVGQEVRHASLAIDWAGRAQVFLVVGTHLDMHPAKRLPEIAERNGALVLTVNREAERLIPKMV